MKITNNLGLKKIELTDSPPDITVQDSNWDLIDETLKEHEDAIGQVNSQLATTGKAEKVGGTASAITLSAVTLKDGSIKTFIAKADNNAVATTINGKPLYKPNTTTAPKLKANTAVTVWYDLTGDCFFIKASAGGGTALPSDVLAPKTFSNDDNSEIIGTIPSKAAATYTPSTTEQEIASGQYLSGKQTIKGDAKLLPANIAKGTTIFNVTGTLDIRQLNFPLSIQDTTPTPVRTGHIWVKSATLAAQITKVKILESLNAGETDGTLMFIVGDLANHIISFSNTITPTDGSNDKTVSMANTTDSSKTWDVMYKTGSVASSFKIQTPIAYSKVGGVLDIETTYFYNGSSWVQLCQKGTYAITAPISNYASKVYNKLNDALTINTSITGTGTFGEGTGSTGNCTSVSSSVSNDGTYFIHGFTLFKRIGDVYSAYYTFTGTTYSGYTVYVKAIKVTTNGNRFFVAYVYYDGSGQNYYLASFIDNGTTLVQEYISAVISTSVTGSGHTHTFDCNMDGTIVAYTYPTTTTNNGWTTRLFYLSGGTYASGSAIQMSSTPSMCFNPYGNQFAIHYTTYNGSSTSYYTYIYDTALSATTLTNLRQMTGYQTSFYIKGFHPSGYVLIWHSTNSTTRYSYNISTSTLSVQVFPSTVSSTYTKIYFSVDGTRCIINDSGTTYYYYSVSLSGDVFTFTQLSTGITTYYGHCYIIPK